MASFKFVIFGIWAIFCVTISETMKLPFDYEVKGVGDAEHPCYRECITGDTRTCEYDFLVTEYISMSVDCGDCPFNQTDCFKPMCITAGGYIRPVSVVNFQLPGTGIEVCLGDTIAINVRNEMPLEGITIHWHGIHQRKSQYMDGVPGVTQCPIINQNSFKYVFEADMPGTHMWHSHSGFEEADGMFGPLVVRRPKAEDPNGNLYDYDLSEHKIMIWHWFPRQTKEYIITAELLGSRAYGSDFIINGKGKIATFLDEVGNPFFTPREVFTVSSGSRYRFRLAFNTAVNCPAQVSIDNHKLLIIAVDGSSVVPTEVDSFMVHGGERIDFVLTADQPVGNYWLRTRGLEDCTMGGAMTHQEAILRYEGAPQTEPDTIPTYEEANVPGTLLNPLFVGAEDYSNNSIIRISDLTNNDNHIPDDVDGTPDHVIYLGLAINTYDGKRGFYPQLNNITFQMPGIPIMAQRDIAYCTDNNLNEFCSDAFCSCPYVIETGLNGLVEIVFVETSPRGVVDHPLHLHGYAFRVVAMNNFDEHITVEQVKQMNEAGLITKKLQGAPLKDTLAIPYRGYAVVRFRANNPGYWIFHCHMSNHAHYGMITVLKVGDHSEMPNPPIDFPKCGNWKPL